jgi:hypothetical protein
MEYVKVIAELRGEHAELFKKLVRYFDDMNKTEIIKLALEELAKQEGVITNE